MAAKISAKCLYCGQTFDRNGEGCYRIPRKSKFRYAHIGCFEALENKPEGAEKIEPVVEEKKTKIKIDRTKVTDYIQEIFGDEARWTNISNQINNYLKKGYTIDGIYNALYYWYDIKGNSIEKANGGIGIVDYIYEDAEKYFKALEKINEINELKVATADSAKDEEIIRIKYSSPDKKVKCYLGRGVEDFGF